MKKLLNKVILKEILTDDSFSKKDSDRLLNNIKKMETDCKGVFDQISMELLGSLFPSNSNVRSMVISKLRSHSFDEETESRIIALYNSTTEINKNVIDDIFISLCGWSMVSLINREL